MSKAIAIFDEIPESCGDCPLADTGWCRTEHDACPLVEAIGYVEPVGNMISWEDDNDVD